MTIDEAKRILATNEYGYKGASFELDSQASGNGRLAIRLDGDFTLEELEAIVAIRKAELTNDSPVQFVNRSARVTRLTTGHGSSDLGIEVILNPWGKVDFPGLIEGETLQVQIRRIKSG